MARSCDVVVVGGGILGLCAAVHLAELGAGTVVLVERETSLGTQTTSAGAGFVAGWGGAADARLARLGAEFYARVQDEDGADLGVRRSGLLLPALSPAGVALLRARQRGWGAGSGIDWIGPEETVRRAPIITPGSVLGALFQPDAYQVPTTAIAAALGRRLGRLGVDVRLGSNVRGMVVRGGRVRGVVASSGTIATGAVVNAAGAGAWALGVRDGVLIPAVPILESRYVTEAVPTLPAALPMLLFFERDLLYLRSAGEGLLVGAVERRLGEPSLVPPGAPPPVAALPGHALISHERLAHSCADVIPVLGRARYRAGASGLPTFTPDGQHVVGPAPGLDGYYVLAGCNEAGVSHGPALGRMIAEMVIRGAGASDPSPYRVDRFAALSTTALRQGAQARYLNRHPRLARDPTTQPTSQASDGGDG